MLSVAKHRFAKENWAKFTEFLCQLILRDAQDGHLVSQNEASKKVQPVMKRSPAGIDATPTSLSSLRAALPAHR